MGREEWGEAAPGKKSEWAAHPSLIVRRDQEASGATGHRRLNEVVGQDHAVVAELGVPEEVERV